MFQLAWSAPWTVIETKLVRARRAQAAIGLPRHSAQSLVTSVGRGIGSGRFALLHPQSAEIESLSPAELTRSMCLRRHRANRENPGGASTSTISNSIGLRRMKASSSGKRGLVRERLFTDTAIALVAVTHGPYRFFKAAAKSTYSNWRNGCYTTN